MNDDDGNGECGHSSGLELSFSSFLLFILDETAVCVCVCIYVREDE